MKEQLKEYWKRIFKERLQAVLTVGALIILGLLVFVLFSSTVVAREQFAKGTSVRRKYFTTIQVQKGDTLWSIAKCNMSPEYENITDYIREVKMSNRLDNDTINAGCYLLIPYYDTEPRKTVEDEPRLSSY